MPHYDVQGGTQFLTWRLADSLPAERLHQLREELKDKPDDTRKKEWYSGIERLLDAGFGSQFLKNPVAARIVQQTLIAQHGTMFELHAWCVMPNHVHTLLTPLHDQTLGKIMQKLKGRSSFCIGQLLVYERPLWQVEYVDRLIRDDEHFNRVLEYIEWNPVKAGLCVTPADWTYSSANPSNWDDGLSAQAAD